FTPGREEIGEVLADLVPAEPEEVFRFVEIGTGAGWLSELVLRRFPGSSAVAVDGSQTMIERAAETLRPFAGRVELRPFRLEDSAWLDGLGGPVRCFLSSLVLHHLDGPGKRALFAELHRRLEPGGGLLIADVVEASSEWARRHLAHAWDEEVRRRSI